MGKRPTWRTWAVVIGALIAYVAVFDRLERLAAPDPPARAGAVEKVADPPKHARPTVHRNEGGVEVVLGWYRTTVRLGEGDMARDDLAVCIEQALDRAESEGRLAVSSASAGLFARFRREAEIAEEMNRIVHLCLPDRRLKADLEPPGQVIVVEGDISERSPEE